MKQVTLKDVSQAAGVSIQTVSKVLSPRYRTLFRDETCERVTQAARSLGYRPNAAARAMLKQRSHIIGVLVPIVHSGWFFQLDVFETMLGMNERLAREGYVTSVIPVWELESDGQMSRAFREQLLDGVVVIGWVPDSVCQVVQDVAPVCVWCDTDRGAPKGCIRRDEHYAGHLAAEQLIGLGYRRLVWVTYASLNIHYSSRDRLAGIREVAGQRQVPLEVIKCTTPSVGEESPKLISLLRPDTAVLAEHMHFAQAVANLAQHSGLSAGKDYGLAACDYSRERAGIFPGLSRVVIDRAEIGTYAAEMVLEGLSGKKLPKSKLFRGQWHGGNTARRLS